jgi:tetratricopeptide (TPR) repeat protein
MRPGIPDSRQQAAAAIEETLRRARFALQAEAYAEVEALTGEILKRYPGHVEATKVLASALLSASRTREAITPLEKAARNSRDPECETLLAIALRKTGDNDGALLWLKRAIKRQPPFAAAFHELGFVYSSLKRHDEAVATLRAGIAVAPMMIELHLQLGALFQSLNDSVNAGQCFAQALDINSGNTEALYGLGETLIERRDYAAAADLFRRHLFANPSDAQARISLGTCLLNLGQPDDAFACLRAASARGPQHYAKALKVAVGSGHGRFWLKPSAAAKFFKG